MQPINIDSNLTSFPIISPAGGLLGYVDEISRTPEKLIVSGWSVADEVGLCSKTLKVSTVPTLERKDVLEVYPGVISDNRGSRLGFHVKAEATEELWFFFLRIGHETHYVHIGF